MSMILKATLMLIWGMGNGADPYEIYYFLPDARVAIFEVKEAGNRFMGTLGSIQGPTHIYFKKIQNIPLNSSKYPSSQTLDDLYGKELATSIRNYIDNQSNGDEYFKEELVPMSDMIDLDVTNELTSYL